MYPQRACLSAIAYNKMQSNEQYETYKLHFRD